MMHSRVPAADAGGPHFPPSSQYLSLIGVFAEPKLPSTTTPFLIPFVLTTVGKDLLSLRISIGEGRFTYGPVG